MAISTVNPATGEEVTTFEALTEEVIDQKIQRTADTFREYRKSSFAERSRMMLRAAEILEEEAEEFGRLMTSEMGRPWRRPPPRRRSAPAAAATTPRTPSALWPTRR